jgi:hypothetical protein
LLGELHNPHERYDDCGIEYDGLGYARASPAEAEKALQSRANVTTTIAMCITIQSTIAKSKPCRGGGGTARQMQPLRPRQVQEKSECRYRPFYLQGPWNVGTPSQG